MNQNTISEDETPVYFYIKQDYYYMELVDTFSGQITIGDLKKWEEGYRVSSTYQHETEFFKKYPHFDKKLRYSLNEACCIIDNLIEKLLTNQLVSDCADIDYEAFSLKSINQAKQEVKRMIIEQEFD